MQNSCLKEVWWLKENTERQFNKIRKMTHDGNEKFNRQKS